MRILFILGLASMTGMLVASAQTAQSSPEALASAAPPPSAPAKKSATELEKLVEPIALHPDPLIAILLPASAYPLEIVQAARFVRDTNNIPKVDDQDWDDNVKEVAKFPEVVAMMDKDLSWTMELGQAFIDQPQDLMDAIQALRAKAQKAGNLKTSPQQIVTVTNIVVQQTNITEVVNVTKEIVQVVPANPQVVYVPSYPPAVYYPPPAYAYAAPLISFGVGMAWGAVLANNCNWGHSSVDVDVNRDVNRNVNRNTDRNTAGSGNRPSSTSRGSGQKQWQPNQSRMQQSGAKASAGTRDSRGWGGSGSGAGNRPSTGNVGARPSTGNAGARPSTGTAGSRPSGGAGASARPSTSQSSSRGASPSAGNRSSSGGSAFSGAGSGGGSSARASSSRGSSSRSSGGSSRGGGGGGRGGGGGGGRR